MVALWLRKDNECSRIEAQSGVQGAYPGIGEVAEGIILINKEFYAKKNRSKFLNLTIIPTFAFPKKTVDQYDRREMR